MRVTKLSAPQTLVTSQEEAPRVLRDGILLRVDACGLTDCDLKAFLGEVDSPSGVLGGQIAGTVLEAGSEVCGYASGDRLLFSRYIACGAQVQELGMELAGGFAEVLALDGAMLQNGFLAKIPKNVKSEEACAADLAAAVLKAQRICAVAPAQRVLVLGCGPAGCMHTHIAKLRGADIVIQSDVVSSRMEMSRPFMADYLIDTSYENLNEVVWEATDGHGADVTIVAANDPEAMAAAVQNTARGGRLLLFSRFGLAGAAVPMDLATLQKKQITILTSDGYELEDVREALWLVSKRKINLKWLVTSVVDVEQAEKKLNECCRGKELRVVVKP